MKLEQETYVLTPLMNTALCAQIARYVLNAWGSINGQLALNNCQLVLIPFYLQLNGVPYYAVVPYSMKKNGPFADFDGRASTLVDISEIVSLGGFPTVGSIVDPSIASNNAISNRVNGLEAPVRELSESIIPDNKENDYIDNEASNTLPTPEQFNNMDFLKEIHALIDASDSFPVGMLNNRREEPSEDEDKMNLIRQIYQETQTDQSDEEIDRMLQRNECGYKKGPGKFISAVQARNNPMPSAEPLIHNPDTSVAPSVDNRDITLTIPLSRCTQKDCKDFFGFFRSVKASEAEAKVHCHNHNP